jgi:hypothetical protein
LDKIWPILSYALPNLLIGKFFAALVFTTTSGIADPRVKRRLALLVSIQPRDRTDQARQTVELAWADCLLLQFVIVYHAEVTLIPEATRPFLRKEKIMFRRTSLLLSLFVALAMLGSVTQGGEKDKEVKGTIVKVDIKASTLTIKTNGEKAEKTYDVNDKTKFIGPKGGASDARLKDDRLVPGAEVRLLIAGNNRTCREVHLPVRKTKDKK